MKLHSTFNYFWAFQFIGLTQTITIHVSVYALLTGEQVNWKQDLFIQVIALDYTIQQEGGATFFKTKFGLCKWYTCT